MNEAKIFELLGLSKKANLLSYGYKTIEHNILTGKTKLIIFSSDFSKKSTEKISKIAAECGIRTITLTADMNYFSNVTGKPAGVVSVNNDGFCKKILSLI